MICIAFKKKYMYVLYMGVVVCRISGVYRTLGAVVKLVQIS